MCQNTDSPAVLQVVQEKGVYAFGWDSDMTKFAPKAHLSANTNNRGAYYAATIKKVLAGTLKPEVTKWGLKEGLVVMSPVNPVVTAAGKTAFEDKMKALKEGRCTPFQGPVKDQSGTIKVAAGSTMPLAELMGSNWYVQGVEGPIPK
jgi:simple sugar transport system substrate-binding protein